MIFDVRNCALVQGPEDERNCAVGQFPFVIKRIHIVIWQWLD